MDEGRYRWPVSCIRNVPQVRRERPSYLFDALNKFAYDICRCYLQDVQSDAGGQNKAKAGSRSTYLWLRLQAESFGNK